MPAIETCIKSDEISTLIFPYLRGKSKHSLQTRLLFRCDFK